MKTRRLPINSNVVYDDLLFLMDSIQDYAIIRLDPKGNITSWNKGAQHIKGYTAEEAIGRNYSIFYPQEEIAAGVPQANLNLAMAQGSFAKVALRLKKDGSVFWGDMVLTALRTNDGSLRGFVKITKDITKQKEHGDELERLRLQASQIITEKLNVTLQENKDYKYALDESAIVAITDQKGIIIHVNDNFCTISKFSREELLGQDHRIINSGYHDKGFICDLWTTIANGKIWKGEIKNKAKDGTFYWLDTTIVPFVNREGKPYQYIAIGSDITLWKQEEAHLKLLESVILNTKDAVLITEAQLLDEPGPRIIFMNQAFTQMTGYTPEEVLGKTPRIFQGPKSDKNELKRLSVALRRFEPCETTVINYRKNGEEFWTNFTVSPVSDEKGQYSHFIAIQRDVTQRKIDELQLVKIAEALQESEKKYSELFQLSPLPMFVFDLETLTFLDANNTFLKNYGYEMEELLLLNMNDIRSPDEVLVFEVALLESNLTEQSDLGLYKHRKKNGEIIQVDIQSNFIQYKGKNARVTIATDVTERLKYVEAIETQNENLREISWIQSHLVRAPLARILGLLPMVIDLNESIEERKKISEYLMLSATELDALIKKIAHKSRESDYRI